MKGSKGLTNERACHTSRVRLSDTSTLLASTAIECGLLPVWPSRFVPGISCKPQHIPRVSSHCGQRDSKTNLGDPRSIRYVLRKRQGEELPRDGVNHRLELVARHFIWGIYVCVGWEEEGGCREGDSGSIWGCQQGPGECDE